MNEDCDDKDPVVLDNSLVVTIFTIFRSHLTESHLVYPKACVPTGTVHIKELWDCRLLSLPHDMFNGLAVDNI